MRRGTAQGSKIKGHFRYGREVTFLEFKYGYLLCSASSAFLFQDEMHKGKSCLPLLPPHLVARAPVMKSRKRGSEERWKERSVS